MSKTTLFLSTFMIAMSALHAHDPVTSDPVIEEVVESHVLVQNEEKEFEEEEKTILSQVEEEKSILAQTEDEKTILVQVEEEKALAQVEEDKTMLSQIEEEKTILAQEDESKELIVRCSSCPRHRPAPVPAPVQDEQV